MKNLYLLTSLLGFNALSAQINFSSISNNTQLSNYIQGYGLTISNMNVHAASGSIAFFAGSSQMAFGNGIIMSTGVVQNDFNNLPSHFLSTNNHFAGDADLNQIISGNITYDACVIEFDFVPDYAHLLFDFSFGSEEYNDYVGTQFNDVFAILLSGPNPNGSQYVNKNLALIPGTNIPVSINTINNGYAGLNFPATGPCTNCNYYVDNDLQQYPIALDGYTKGLLGKALLKPGSAYHMKIAIADAGDEIYDSHVMIKTNSFRTIGGDSVAGVPVKHPGENINVWDTIPKVDNFSASIKIYPNPSNGTFYLGDGDLKISKVEVYTIEGREIEESSIELVDNKLTLKSPQKGIYFIRIYCGERVVVKKFSID